MGIPRKTKVVDKLMKVFGSQAEIGRICGIDKSTVNRWNNVPAKYHRKLLDAAKKAGQQLAHADLIA